MMKGKRVTRVGLQSEILAVWLLNSQRAVTVIQHDMGGVAVAGAGRSLFPLCPTLIINGYQDWSLALFQLEQQMLRQGD
eukprot:40182-Pelagomonas_calceolata.AAC.2